MPVLPRYESNENINTSLPAPERHQAADNAKDMQNVLGTLQDITQQWSKVNDVMQETKLKTYYETALAKQEQAAANDPNPDNMQAHIQALQDIQKNAPKIDNQEVAGNANLEMQQSSYLSKIKIQDIFQKKQLFANNQSLDQLATTTAQNVANAVSPMAGKQDEDNFMRTVQDNYSRGAISQERANGLVKDYKVGVVKNKIAQNGSTNADDYKGLTDGLDLKESNEIDKMVQAHIKQNQQKDIQNTLKNRVSTIKNIADGKFTWQNSDQISKVAAQDPKLGEALQAVFNADAKGEQYAPESDQNQDFADLTNKLFATKTKEEVSDYLVKVLNSSGERNMSKDRLSILVNAAEQRGATLDTNKESGDGKDDPAQKAVETNVKHIQEFHKDNPDSGNVFADFLKGLAGGTPPAQAKDTAIKNYNIQQYAWIGNLPKEGAVYRDKVNGAKRRIFPDGSFKEEQ